MRVSIWNSGPSNQSAGVAMLVSKHLQHEIEDTNLEDLGRRISIDVKVQNKTLYIYGRNKR